MFYYDRTEKLMVKLEQFLMINNKYCTTKIKCEKLGWNTTSSVKAPYYDHISRAQFNE